MKPRGINCTLSIYIIWKNNIRYSLFSKIHENQSYISKRQFVVQESLILSGTICKNESLLDYNNSIHLELQEKLIENEEMRKEAKDKNQRYSIIDGRYGLAPFLSPISRGEQLISTIKHSLNYSLFGYELSRETASPYLDRSIVT